MATRVIGGHYLTGLAYSKRDLEGESRGRRERNRDVKAEV